VSQRHKLIFNRRDLTLSGINTYSHFSIHARVLKNTAWKTKSGHLFMWNVYTMWFKALVLHLRIVLRRSFWAENISNFFFFKFITFSKWRFLHWCHSALLWLFEWDSVLRVCRTDSCSTLSRFRQYQCHTIGKVLKKEHSEVMTEKWYKGQNFFPLLQKGTQLPYNVRTSCFHSVKIDNRNNKCNTNGKTL
jgi:hypothetical protein